MPIRATDHPPRTVQIAGTRHCANSLAVSNNSNRVIESLDQDDAIEDGGQSGTQLVRAVDDVDGRTTTRRDLGLALDRRFTAHDQ